MPRHIPYSRLFSAALLVGAWTLLLGGACTDPIGPNDYRPIAIAVGDTVVGAFHAGDTLRLFRFGVPGGTYYAVFLQALSGTVGVRVGYPGFIVPLGTVIASPGPPLGELATDAFRAQVRGEMEIRLSKPVAGGPDAQFRFFVEEVNGAPEVRASGLQVGDTVSGETLESIVDFDDFIFPGQAGQVVIGLLQAQDPIGSGTIRLELSSPDGSLLASTTSFGGDSVLGDQVSGPFVLPATVTYHATVRSLLSGYPSKKYQGPYRFALVPLQVAPELGPADIAIGDTVRDEVNPIGDIDEYRFTGAAGQEVNVFFQAMSGRASDVLYLDVPVLVGGYPASVQSLGTDTGLTSNATGRFTLPLPGPHLIRVSGADGGPGGDRGPYRLYLYPIDRRPEGAAANLVLGDSATAAIELPGDIDEYTLTAPSTGLANIVVWRDAAGRGSALTLGLDDPFSTCGGGLEVVPGQDAQGTGTFSLAGGSHRLSVCGDSHGFGYAGGYRVETFAIDSLPESRSDTIVIGDTIGTEALQPPGDIDRFVFYGTRARHIDVYFQGEAATSRGGFYLQVGGADSNFTLAEARTPASAPTLSGQHTHRIDLPMTGWYRIRVSPSQNGGDPRERGAYRVALLSFDASPETAARQITLGDSVGTESIDYDDDLDEFTLTGPPGTEFTFFGLSGPRLVVYDTTTQDVLPQGANGLYALPATGTVGLRVSGPIGPYWLKPVRVSRTPETVLGTFTVGDTVRGEAISPIGDIDEFTSSGTPGEQVTLYDRLTITSPVDSAVILEVIDPATGASLTGSNFAAAGSAFLSVGSFTVPASGTFMVRARAYGYARETAPYEFFVQR